MKLLQVMRGATAAAAFATLVPVAHAQFFMVMPTSAPPASGSGKAIEEKNVLAGKVQMDPTKAYILVNDALVSINTFLREPDAETIAAWNRDRQAALAKAQKKYADQLMAWEEDVAALKTMQANAKLPPKPVEPTLDTVDVERLELRGMVVAGPLVRYTKKDRNTYLQEVKPGTYIWAGGGPTGPICLCMGTVKFEAKAGTITNLGNMLQALPRTDLEPVKRLTPAEIKAIKRQNDLLPPGSQPNMAVPDSLKAWPVVEAELHAAGKMNNLWSMTVGRLAPIPGVLSYRRDTVIDERTGQALPNPKLVSMQKPKI